MHKNWFKNFMKNIFINHKQMHHAKNTNIPQRNHNKKKILKFQNFAFFLNFFFTKRFLLILTKQKWCENNKNYKFKKKKSYWLITNYWLFNVSLLFFVSYARDTIAKSQCYSKTYVDSSHKNNKGFFHKTSHFQFASTTYFAQLKKNDRKFFFILKTRQWRFNFIKKKMFIKIFTKWFKCFIF